MDNPAREKLSGALERMWAAIPAIESCWPRSGTMTLCDPEKASIWGAQRALVHSRPGSRIRFLGSDMKNEYPVMVEI
jgi:hypothetical protein